MAEITTQAASSPAETADVFNGQQPTMEEYSSYRTTGELPARFKPAEPAANDTPEQTAAAAEVEEPEIAPESDPEKAQEPPQKSTSPAEKRIKELLAKNKDLERKLAAQPPTDAKPDSSTATATPQKADPQYTRPKPKPEGMNQDGKPYATYEDYVEDLANWSGEQKLAQFQRSQAEQQAQKALQTKLDDARARYTDADDVIFPTADAIGKANIPPVVKQVIEDSDVFVDLCYVIGSDSDELKKLVALAQTNPRAAIGRVFEYERGIKEALGKTSASGAAPEKKQTQAPKPPSPVGGSNGRAFDANDDSLSADEWMRKRNAQLANRGH